MEEESTVDHALLDELWGTVSDELAELAEEMESALLELEQDAGNGAVINSLFRAMHTYKSSAGMMGFSVTEALAHRSEDLVDYFRDKDEPLPPHVLELMLESVDMLATLREHVTEHRTDASSELTRELIHKLSGALSQAGGEVVVTAEVEEFVETSLGLDEAEFAELWETVSDEMVELLDVIEESLLALETDPTNGDLIGKLFRAMHTFKSSSGMMGLSVMEQIAHRSEDLVGGVRDNGFPLTESHISLLLEALDRLHQLHRQASAGQADGPPSASAELIHRLEASLRQEPPASSVTEGETESGDGGFGFFDDDGPQIPVSKEDVEEDGFGFFGIELESKDEGFGFFMDDDESKSEPEPESDDGFGFFDMEPSEDENEGFGFFEDDQKGIWELTVDETRDNLNEIEDALLHLERNAEDHEQIDRLFRAIHTIKGTANVMGLVRVESVAHRSEDLVGLARDRAITVTAPVVTLLLESMDLIRVGLDKILKDNSDLTEREVKSVLSKLDRFLQNPSSIGEPGLQGDEAQADEEVSHQDTEEAEDPSKDPLYVKIFVEMGWEALERLNGVIERLAGDPSDALFGELKQELEELEFASQRMGYEEVFRHLEQMKSERDLMVLNEMVGWIGGQLTDLEDFVSSGLSSGGEDVPMLQSPPPPPPLPGNIELHDASDDDFFGGEDAFDEVAQRLPQLPDGALILEPESEDEVDPVFTPVFVQDFLEKEEGQLIGLRTIWEQTDLSEQERAKKIIALLNEVEADAGKMGYDHLIEIIESGRRMLARSHGDHLQKALDELELDLYEELTAIQEAVPELTRTAAGDPLDISWIFRQSHAERVYEELTDLSYLIDLYEVMHDNPKLDRVPDMDGEAEKHLRSIHHAALFYNMKTAAGLALSLADCFTRIGQFESNTVATLFLITRDFAQHLGSGIDSECDGSVQDSSVYESMMGQVEDLLYMNSGSTLIKSARDVLALLDLPEDFFGVFTPDSLHAVGESLEKEYHFYVIHTDMDQNEEVALGFYHWSQSDQIEIITNFTVFKEGRSMFDFLVASPLEAMEIEQQLLEIDSGRQLLCLRKSALRSDLDGMQPAAVEEEGSRLASAGNFSTDELMEAVGDLVSVQAMLHHVTATLAKLDLLGLADEEMANSSQWSTARALLEGKVDELKRQGRILGQLENQIGTSVVKLQELVHLTDAVVVARLFDDVDEWMGTQASDNKKSVRLERVQLDLEVERRLLEKLEGTLHTLLGISLNSIESVVKRMELGKSSTAEIKVSASKSHDMFELTLQDDGSGLDHDQLQQQLQHWEERTGRESELEPEKAMLQDGFGEVLFHDGQTRFDFSRLRKQIEVMGGYLRIRQRTGQGLQIRILLPLSIVVVNGLVVRVGQIRYVIPVNLVRRIVQVGDEQMVHASADGGKEMLHLDGRLIPLKMLTGMTLDSHSRHLIVVVDVGDEGEQVACPVDELIDQQQVMIRPLQGVLSDVQDASGIAVLGDGEVGVVLRLESIH